MTDWQIFVSTFHALAHPVWDPDLFWGLFVGVVGYVLIVVLCFWTASCVVGDLEEK